MTQKPRMTLIYSGRFPGEKAGALFAAKSAEAFTKQGYEVTLLVPNRSDSPQKSVEAFWDIREDFTVLRLPIVNLFPVPILRKIAFFVAAPTYVVSVFFHMLRNRRSIDLAYSNEAFPLLAASYVVPAVYELHDFPQRALWVYRMLFRRVRLIVSTNEWKRDQLVQHFDVPADRILVERNAVDLGESLEKSAARQQLGLQQEATYVVYTGQLYSWKGADTLATAAEALNDATVVFVGGLGEDLERFKVRWGTKKNIRIIGQVSHSKATLWQRAADVLVLPNTGKEEISAHYTSPMKLFEYMAAERPIVASDLPSIREVVNDGSVYFAKPDDDADFARVIKHALSDPTAPQEAEEARKKVLTHTWIERAKRITRAIEEKTI